MNVIIVESPTKARTLTKYLKGEYDVVATMGHIRDLPKAELGVDVEKNFTPRYIIPRDKAKNAKALKDVAKKARTIILATDPDREGEAIAWHVSQLLKCDGKRIVFSDPDALYSKVFRAIFKMQNAFLFCGCIIF